MKAPLRNQKPGGLEERRIELALAMLGVQAERIKLTESFMQPILGYGPREVEVLILRLLRLQRAIQRARHLTSAQASCLQ
jgi:hypothetical protein